MKYFKEGDLVTCSIYGKGVVTHTNYGTDSEYPIRVKFESESGRSVTYTNDGRFVKIGKRTLHQGHVNIPEPELIPIVEYTKGEIVWYRAIQYWYVGFYDSGMLVRSQAGDYTSTLEIRKFDNPPTFKP